MKQCFNASSNSFTPCQLQTGCFLGIFLFDCLHQKSQIELKLKWYCEMGLLGPYLQLCSLAPSKDIKLILVLKDLRPFVHEVYSS